MNTVITNGNLIKKIRDGQDLNAIAAYVRNQIFKNGPEDTVVLEILSYLKLFQSQFFKTFECEILETMGLFYKDITPDSLIGTVFDIYHKYIVEQYGENFTPMQVNILKQIKEKQFFSFSAPTSTGKSFVFRNLIRTSTKDVVVIVPSRALINEYYDRIKELVNIKEVNVLTFVDHINTKHVKRNIFILTPERARELFKNQNWLQVEYLLFDEAQLSDDKSVRGFYFDSIVRRAIKTFSGAKFIFAHPFISNPEAQFKRNSVVEPESVAICYKQKNVGQIFYIHDVKSEKFYHFGSNKGILGRRRLATDFDPIEKTIREGGSVLIYVAKTHIYNGQIFKQFNKYTGLCSKIQNPDALKMIEELRGYIGAERNDQEFYNSVMIENLSYGIVTHHGSMPLKARLIVEHFTQRGFCRICFATSTLEQGINMPFDLVYLDRLESSKSLSVKNLIGRAGRSTMKKEFDYGSVVVHSNQLTNFRKVINNLEPLSEVSKLDSDNELIDEKYIEIKDAINNNEFSDEYNLANSDLEKLKTDSLIAKIPSILNIMFTNGKLNPISNVIGTVSNQFSELYEYYLNRELSSAEKGVFNEAVRIMFLKIYGKTFNSICRKRYAYITCIRDRQKLLREGKIKDMNNLLALYTVGCHDIPDKNLKAYPLFPSKTKAKDVNYDLIVYDTYDYLDKLIGFKLGDLFYAMFHQFYQFSHNEDALKLAKYFKYGTIDEREIWMIRYGLTFEDIEWASQYIEEIDETEIKFKQNKLHELTEAQRKVIEPFIYI